MDLTDEVKEVKQVVPFGELLSQRPSGAPVPGTVLLSAAWVLMQWGLSRLTACASSRPAPPPPPPPAAHTSCPVQADIRQYCHGVGLGNPEKDPTRSHAHKVPAGPRKKPRVGVEDVVRASVGCVLVFGEAAPHPNVVQTCFTDMQLLCP